MVDFPDPEVPVSTKHICRVCSVFFSLVVVVVSFFSLDVVRASEHTVHAPMHSSILHLFFRNSRVIRASFRREERYTIFFCVVARTLLLFTSGVLSSFCQVPSHHTHTHTFSFGTSTSYSRFPLPSRERVSSRRTSRALETAGYPKTPRVKRAGPSPSTGPRVTVCRASSSSSFLLPSSLFLPTTLSAIVSTSLSLSRSLPRVLSFTLLLLLLLLSDSILGFRRNGERGPKWDLCLLCE